MMLRCSSCGTENRIPASRLDQKAKCGRCKAPIGPFEEPYTIGSAAEFGELIAQSPLPILVDFWAAWCGPCKMVAPEMEKLAAKYDGTVDVVKVDVDANPGLSQAFNILSIPVIAFFKPGAQPQGVVGFRPLEQLEQTFNLSEFTPVAAD